MTLFRHHGGTDSTYISQFHIRQGDRAAGLSWSLVDGPPREVLVFQSTQGFVEDVADPRADDRQQLVYQGTELHARLTDAGLSDDVAYHYPDDIAYYYSVFARGDDGAMHLQLVARATPRSVGSWTSPGREGDDQISSETSETARDRDLGYLARR